MKKYAVAYISFFDNELIVEIIEAENIKSAIKKHCSMVKNEEFINDMPDDIGIIKDMFHECDSAIDVMEVS